MITPQILILDYSVDRSEAEHINHWLPAAALVSSFFIDTAASFPDDLINQDFTHIIHSGSALSVTATAPFEEKAFNFIRASRDKGVSQMGICYGHQLVCKALVGEHAVRSAPNGMEAGWNDVSFVNSAPNLLGVGQSEVVWQHHFDEVTELPAGSELLATNPHSSIQAYLNVEQRLLGTQFHPEFAQEAGNEIFRQDRAQLEKHGYDVDAMITGGPSFNVGRVFFDFFLSRV